MKTIEILIALIIHVFIPLTGLLYFLRLKNRMKKEEIQNAPLIELFLLFATYGGLLLVVLTALCWQWSGMASLGTYYLILGAPFIMGIVAFRNRRFRKYSKELSIYNILKYQI